jgi:hypothetical protein
MWVNVRLATNRARVMPDTKENGKEHRLVCLSQGKYVSLAIERENKRDASSRFRYIKGNSATVFGTKLSAISY